MTNRFPRIVGAVACLFASVACASVALAQAKPPTPPDDVEFARDVVYGKGGGEDLKLDISVPKNADHALPCVVVIHGGGWAAGNKAGHDNLTWEFARRGYVSATVGYRFAPAHPWPAQIEDVKCAVRFLRAHAKDYHIDPDHIGAIGFSAGAHLSMMLGTTKPEDHLEGAGGWPDQSSRVQAVVSYFGPTDLTAKDMPAPTTPILQRFLGGTPDERPDVAKQASPITYVRPDTAPMLLFQGTKDPLVTPTQATRMAEALTQAGVPGRVELLLGQSHGWGNPELKRTADASFSFFDAVLRKDAASKP